MTTTLTNSIKTSDQAFYKWVFRRRRKSRFSITSSNLVSGWILKDWWPLGPETSKWLNGLLLQGVPFEKSLSCLFTIFKRSQSDALQEEAFVHVHVLHILWNAPYSNIWPRLSPVEPGWAQLSTFEPSCARLSTVEHNLAQLSTIGPSWAQLSPVEYSWAQLCTVEP